MTRPYGCRGNTAPVSCDAPVKGTPTPGWHVGAKMAFPHLKRIDARGVRLHRNTPGRTRSAHTEEDPRADQSPEREVGREDGSDHCNSCCGRGANLPLHSQATAMGSRDPGTDPNTHRRLR